MSLVANIIYVYGKEFHQNLPKLNLSQKEQKLFKILYLTNTLQVDKKKITQKLDITEIYFDSLSHHLLQKLYHFLAPSHGISLIQKLISNISILYPNFLKEVKNQELLLHENKSDHLDLYFFQVANLYTFVPTKYFEFKYLLYFTEQYIENSQDKDIAKVVAQALCLIGEVYLRGADTTIHQSELKDNLESRCKNLIGVTNTMDSYLAKFYANYALIKYYNYITPTNITPENLQQSSHYLAQISALLPEKIIIDFYAQKSTYLMMSDQVQEAYESFIQLESFIPDALGNNLYPSSKFVQICLILKKYEEVSIFLEKYYKKYTTLKVASPNVIICCLCYAKYHLLTDNYEEAYKFIYTGRNFLNKNLYVQYEIEFRNLELSYFVLTSNYTTAYHLCEKNLQYIKSKNKILKGSSFGIFYKLMQVLIKNMYGNEKYTQKQKEWWAQTQKGSWKIYGALLQKCKDHLRQP